MKSFKISKITSCPIYYELSIKMVFLKTQDENFSTKEIKFYERALRSIGRCLYISDTLQIYLFSAQSFNNLLYENSSPIVPSVIAELFTYHCGEQVLVCEAHKDLIDS